MSDMNINKSWMQIRDRGSIQYEVGVDEFLDFAFSQPGVNDMIKCPCTSCNNCWPLQTRSIVKYHLFRNGIDKGYTCWYHHGEKIPEAYRGHQNASSNEMRDLVNAVFADRINPHPEQMDQGTCTSNVEADTNEQSDSSNRSHNKESENYYKLLEECEQPLFPDCEKFSKLSFLVRLLNIKCLYAASDACFSAILDLLVEAFPMATFPSSYYEVKKIIRDLGFCYDKIDACENDCILYRKEHANLENCPVCGSSRWRNEERALGLITKEKKTRSLEKKIPCKVLRYFPIKPRLQRLFMHSSTALSMRWHKESRIDDGLLRHPADSTAWKSFDIKHPMFALDSRNVRLGLASDGFNPFKENEIPYSVWPVVLLPYNLPPWMCMKSPFFMMALLIPGPKEPGNDIDVYLQPLVEELLDLWCNGVETYDAYAKENFSLRAAILWTINDLPAYRNLSGWSTSGYLGCPCCKEQTTSCRLKYGSKMAYMGHRRFLPMHHRWRKNKKMFDGTVEKRKPPEYLTGEQIQQQLAMYKQVKFGKDPSKIKLTKGKSQVQLRGGKNQVQVGQCSKKRRKRSKSEEVASRKGKEKADDSLPKNWKKKSIFFSLPYWSSLLVNHNLDVMHIEKNICDNILETLMDVKGKTKDNDNARRDMEMMNIRPELWIKYDDKGKVIDRPHASYTLPKNERQRFCQFLFDLKVPDGYASNISRCVNISECKITKLKTHDCHVILHRHLPLALRSLMKKDVAQPLIELCIFLREICSKILCLSDLDLLENQIAITLCKLEMIFPPSFFDIMMHLPIHLAREAKLAGPVQYRWMYGIERYLRMLKSYVRNKARPEGSIAEGYIAQECLNFCANYLERVETRLDRTKRNYEEVQEASTTGLSIFSTSGSYLKAPLRDHALSIEEWIQARIYVLKNCEDITSYINDYLVETADIIQNFDEEFPKWFHTTVSKIRHEKNDCSINQLFYLSQGPNKRVTKYTGYIINGFRFHIVAHDERLKTQNSGVLVKGDEATGCRDYFGVLTDIIELTYGGNYKVVLFRCNWWDVYNEGRGHKIDDYGFILVNSTRSLATDEPYVLASQAEQVYYVRDIKDPKWLAVVKTKPRDLFEMSTLFEDSHRASIVHHAPEPIQENECIGCVHDAEEMYGDDQFTLRRNEHDFEDVASVNIND